MIGNYGLVIKVFYPFCHSYHQYQQYASEYNYCEGCIDDSLNLAGAIGYLRNVNIEQIHHTSCDGRNSDKSHGNDSDPDVFSFAVVDQIGGPDSQG